MRLKIITFVSIVTQNNVSQSVFIETTLHLIVSCVFQYSHGLVGVRTSTNMEQFRRPLVVVYYKLDFTGKRKKETSYWRNRFALHTCSLVVSVSFLCIVFIRSTSKSRPNNIRGKKCLPVRTSVRPQKVSSI